MFSARKLIDVILFSGGFGRGGGGGGFRGRGGGGGGGAKRW